MLGGGQVFTASCKSCQIIQMMIQNCGVASVALHSQMPQSKRLRALGMFKSAQCKVPPAAAASASV